MGEEMRIRLMRKKWTVLVLLLLVWAGTAARAAVFLGEPPESWQEKELLQWTIFDVNEGDAMLLECGGESMMVDGGPDPFREKLRDALDARGLRNGLKYMLNTHYHHDHIDGLRRLMSYGFKPGEFLHQYDERAISRNRFGRQAVAMAQKQGVPVRRVQGGDTLTLGEAKLELFQCTEISEANARSLVVKATFKDASILLCADITGQAQRYFLKQWPQDVLKADIIKMPHHAITPTVPEFLDTVAPEAAVVTNTSKGVTSKSAAQLKSRGWPAFYAGDGTVYAVTDGTDWYLYQTLGEF